MYIHSRVVAPFLLHGKELTLMVEALQLQTQARLLATSHDNKVLRAIVHLHEYALEHSEAHSLAYASQFKH